MNTVQHDRALRRLGANTDPSDHPRAPRVSVLIPTCNRDAYLSEALAGALAQTFVDFEVIVSDNGDSPATRCLVESLNDPRVRYRSNRPKVDARANHLILWAEARGEFIAFLHDDDVWEPRFLERLVAAMTENPQCVLAFSEQTVIDGDGKVLDDATDANTRRWKRDSLAEAAYQPFWLLLAHQTVPMIMGAIFRRDAVRPDEMTPDSHSAFDLWLTYLLCRTGGAAYYVPDRLIRYRVHAASETNRPTDARPGPVFCWEQFLRVAEMQPYRNTVLRRASESHSYAATQSVRLGNGWASRGHSLRALRRMITSHGTVVFLLCMLPTFIARRILRWHDERDSRHNIPRFSANGSVIESKLQLPTAVVQAAAISTLLPGTAREPASIDSVRSVA